MRRHITSPHGRAGCSGLTAMLVSALTAPVYARSLLKVLFRRKLTCTVTAQSIATDRLWTFRYCLAWAIVPIIILAATYHRPYPVMIVWTAVILTVCLAPIAIWRFDRAVSARRAAAALAINHDQAPAVRASGLSTGDSLAGWPGRGRTAGADEDQPVAVGQLRSPRVVRG